MLEARLSVTAVVPTYAVELAKTADGIVPLRLPAVKLVRLAPDTAPNEPDHGPDVTVRVVVRLAEPANGHAPIVLYDTVTAEPPLNVEPETAPAPPLLKVKLFVVFAVTVPLAPSDIAVPLMVTDEFVSDELAILVRVFEAPEMVLLVRV